MATVTQDVAPPAANAPAPPAAGRIPAGERIRSVDALRGFDMFWISGGEELVHALAAATSWHWALVAGEQLRHTPWAGFTFYDLIQPLFLFVTGLTLPLLISRRRAAGLSNAAIIRQLALRAAILFVLGHLDKNGAISLDFAHQRFTGVLNRIGVAGLAAGVIVLFCRTRGRILWTAGLIAAYAALLSFVPAPGRAEPSFLQGENIVDYLDQRVMPGKLASGNHDANGWCSTPSAVATVLAGALAGQWLFSARSNRRKLTGLILAGLGLVAAGAAWSVQLPIIKHLWTSSFVLYTAGWSCLLLALFHGVVDVLRWQTWVKPLLWIGLNPLLIYLLRSTHFVNFEYIATFLVGFVWRGVDPAWAKVWLGVAVLALELALLWCLHRKKFYWRI